MAQFPKLEPIDWFKPLERLEKLVWHGACLVKRRNQRMELLMTDHDQNVPLPLRSQTLLGVCEAIGEDFGFNANFLRVPLGAIVLLNIWAPVFVYVALGLVVLASRMMFHKAKPTRAAEVRSAPVHANSEIEARIAA